MFINISIFNNENNSWINSCANAYYSDNILEAELISRDGSLKYNKIEIHSLLLNKNLDNNNGIFKYNLSKEDDDLIMNQIFPIYNGVSIPHININKCIMLSVNLEKYNDVREETLSILKKYNIPKIEIYNGYTNETVNSSIFYDYVNTKMKLL